MTAREEDRALEARGVLHCVAAGGLYGIERFVLNLLPTLTARGCPAALACLVDDRRRAPASDGTTLGDAYAATGGRAHVVPVRGKVTWHGLRSLALLFRQARPAIVHAHGYKAVILGGLVARLLRLPVVTTCHSEASRFPGVRLQLSVESRALRFYQGAVGVSGAIGRELVERGVRAERVAVIPTGVPDSAATGPTVRPPPARPVLFTAARLAEEKNLDLLLEALARLAGPFPGIALRVAGDGPLRSRLEERAGALGVGARVTFLGFLEDVGAELRSSTCFVLPSRTEGMPIALLEAMSAGCPIVASAVGSIPTLADGGRNALTVPPGDVDALTGAITRVLEDPALADELRRNGRARFERDHTLTRMADAYVAFYRGVLRGEPASSSAVVVGPARPLA